MSDLGPKFYNKLLEVSKSVGMTPRQLLIILGLESRFDPTAGKGNAAAGIGQIMPKNLQLLGYTKYVPAIHAANVTRAARHAADRDALRRAADEFRKEPPEIQLEYVEKLFKRNMGNGKPYESLTHYYISHFLPACLTRDDVKRGDPNAILAEKDPTVSHIPKSSIEFEKLVYKKNSGLDVDKDGKITFGDLTKVLGQVSRRSEVKAQFDYLKKHTNYVDSSPSILDDSKKINPPAKAKPKLKPASPETEDDLEKLLNKYDVDNKAVNSQQLPVTKPQAKAPANDNAAINNLLEYYIGVIKAAGKKYNKQYKKYLPTHNFVIQVFAKDKIDSIEFGRILCSALDEELMAKAYVHTNNDNIEIQCDMQGPQQLCFETIKQLTESIADAFKSATIKLGGINIKANVIMNKKSSYSELTIKSALSNYRKFLLKFV